MVNKKQKGTKKKKHQNAPEEEELLPDPNWCDLELFTGQNPMEPIQVMHATVTPITKFANAMMSIRQFWAKHVSWETAHAIATAISHQCVPWHEDWHQWRFAAQQFFNNLCTHRKKTDAKRDSIISELCDQIHKMDEELKEIKSSMFTMQNAIAKGPQLLDIEVHISKAIDDALRHRKENSDSPKLVNLEMDVSTAIEEALRHREQKLKELSSTEAEMRAIAARSPRADRDSRIDHAIDELRGRAVSPAPISRVEARALSPVPLF